MRSIPLTPLQCQILKLDAGARASPSRPSGMPSTTLNDDGARFKRPQVSEHGLGHFLNPSDPMTRQTGAGSRPSAHRDPGVHGNRAHVAGLG